MTWLQYQLAVCGIDFIFSSVLVFIKNHNFSRKFQKWQQFGWVQTLINILFISIFLQDLVPDYRHCNRSSSVQL